MGQVKYAKYQMDEALDLWETAGNPAALHEAGNNWMMLKAKLQAASERWRELQTTIDDQKTSLGAEEELAGTLWRNLEALFENINLIKSGLDGMGQTIGRHRQDFEDMNQGITGSFDDLVRVKAWLDEFEADREGMSGKLGEISQTGAAIKDFTEQIKLLSFYAAVEVAEMGQEGGAFGGIVSQAQSLSQQAAADSARIGPLLKQVTGQFFQTSDTIRQTQKIMATSLDSVFQARRSLDLARESGGRMEQIVTEAGSGIDRQQSRHQDIFSRYAQYSQSYQEVSAKLQGFSGFLLKGREALAWFERMGSLGRAEIDLAGRENYTGGRLKADISSDPITLDPAMMTDATSNEVASQIFEGLVQFGSGAGVIPAAAWRWKISPDGL
ncbi:MAG: methyl-accepting chemotaxis protein, partial [bacterium]|nr:methyl-accepting chemotaxis protein [bacterium]